MLQSASRPRTTAAWKRTDCRISTEQAGRLHLRRHKTEGMQVHELQTCQWWHVCLMASAEWRTEEWLKSKRNAWINKWQRNCPMGSFFFFKYCLKPPPSQAYNSLVKPPPHPETHTMAVLRTKPPNPQENETGLQSKSSKNVWVQLFSLTRKKMKSLNWFK